jgi:hypothetical protein
VVIAKINPPPREPRLIVGRMLRVESFKPYLTYDHSSAARANGQLLTVKEINGVYVKLIKEQDGAFEEFTAAKQGSKFSSVSKEEAEALRRKWSERLKYSPVGAANPTHGAPWKTGSDPEVFALDGQNNVIPAWSFLPDKKHPIKEVANEGRSQMQSLFWDGYQAEFTAPEDTCHAYLVDSVRNGIQRVYQRAKTIVHEAKVTHACVVEIDLEMARASPAAGVVLGCDPSKNAYTEANHLNDIDPFELPIRFAGFHIHFGMGQQSEAMYKRVVKLLDAIIGVSSVTLLEGLEDVRRRHFYGLAGEYRTPEHGLEWRSLSSACLIHPAVTHLMLDFSRLVSNLAHKGFHFLWQANEAEVRDCINHLDVELARKILAANKQVLEALLRSFGDTYQAKALRLIRQGAKNLLPTDMKQNWRLDGYWERHCAETGVTMASAKV